MPIGEDQRGGNGGLTKIKKNTNLHLENFATLVTWVALVSDGVHVTQMAHQTGFIPKLFATALTNVSPGRRAPRSSLYWTMHTIMVVLEANHSLEFLAALVALVLGMRHVLSSDVA